MITSAVISPDTGDTDGDPSTDQRIELSWFSFSTAFPGTDLPATLAELSFSTTSLSADPITGAPLSTTLNLSSDSTAINYSFSVAQQPSPPAPSTLMLMVMGASAPLVIDT